MRLTVGSYRLVSKTGVSSICEVTPLEILSRTHNCNSGNLLAEISAEVTNITC